MPYMIAWDPAMGRYQRNCNIILYIVDGRKYTHNSILTIVDNS